MSQPRRRRRNRRRRSGGSGGSNEPSKREAVEQSRSESEEDSNRRSRSRRSSRGRRGRTRARESGPRSPKSSEDLVRGDPKRRPGSLTGPHDGTTLEQVIGELQSSWGVPQHPQEYRITLKVADERSERAQVTEERADPEDVEATTTGAEDRPRREKAPAAPRIGAGAAEAESPSGAKPTKKRRSRRRRRRSKGGGGN